MAIISSPTYDPTTTATNLANAYVAPTKALLDAQAAKAKNTTAALGKLGSALNAFQSSLATLTSGTKSITATAATFSGTGIATASATSKAAAGSYAFYVEKLATAGQVSYNIADNVAASAGNLNIALADGTTIQVSLANADTDKSNPLTAKEIAAAINASASSSARVTASTMTVGSVTKLVLTSTKTGADNNVTGFSVDDTTTPTPVTTTPTPTVINTGTNALIHIGSSAGEAIEQASNTFTIIDNVSFTVTQAQAPGAAPVTLTVGADNGGTATNVQSFITAYNTLMTAIDALTAAGDHTPVSSSNSSSTSEDAPLHGDAGIASLRDRINGLLRGAVGGQSLISYGISAGRDGKLTLDSARMNKAVAANPDGLDKLFGRAGLTVDSGVLGSMNKLVTAWTNSSTGYINSRTTAATRQQSDIADRLVTVENQFNNAYKRYLAQFTALQQLQSSMTSTSNLFTALFTPDSSN